MNRTSHIREYFLLPLLLLSLSCGTRKSVSEQITTKSDGLSVKNIIKNHYKNQLRFKTIRGRIKVAYSDGTSAKGVTVSFRMKKDNTIWLSAPLNMAKVLITPNRISFYNKLDNTYFDDDFSYLSDLLGMELDFDKLQNILLGQALFNLKSTPYIATVIQDTYQLKPEKEMMLFKKLFLIAPPHFRIISQQLAQPEKNRTLKISYKDYQYITDNIFPGQIELLAMDTTDTITIGLVYKNVEFNKKVSFPYHIPEGYKEIVKE